MTGDPVPPLSLRPGEVIHLAPHEVWGNQVCKSELDVQVARARDMGEVVAVDWEACPAFPGARPALTGTTLYRATQRVLVIGHAA